MGASRAKLRKIRPPELIKLGNLMAGPSRTKRIDQGRSKLETVESFFRHLRLLGLHRLVLESFDGYPPLKGQGTFSGQLDLEKVLLALPLPPQVLSSSYILVGTIALEGFQTKTRAKIKNILQSKTLF